MLWSPPDAQLDDRVNALVDEVRGRLRTAAGHGGVRLASSLQVEDQILTHLIAEQNLPVSLFMLDTGRLHDETLALAAATEERYALSIERVRPDADEVAKYVARFGVDGFYDSLEARQACCAIRKVAPLEAALASTPAWITGQRREQTPTRAHLPFEERDQAGRQKFNPLADWTTADVWAVARAFDIPVHPLSFRGYPSIGCEPCTRAIRVGEDLRAGRWWWETSDAKECGLHVALEVAQ